MNYDITISEPKAENIQFKNIRDVLYRRSDLSTFVVHLTKDKTSLKSIIRDWKIEAKSVWGLAKNKIKEDTSDEKSQKCVCFTETPFEYLSFLIEKIEGRSFKPGHYGIAITKKLARNKGINPIWYIDISPGNNRDKWITKYIEELIELGKKSEEGFTNHPIAQITPFVEPMGKGNNQDTGESYCKEFWWEREWRHIGDFELPNHLIIICPEDEFPEFEALVQDKEWKPKCIDPNWGLEKIIAHLAGFDNREIDIL